MQQPRQRRQQRCRHAAEGQEGAVERHQRLRRQPLLQQCLRQDRGAGRVAHRKHRRQVERARERRQPAGHRRQGVVAIGWRLGEAMPGQVD
ncbi:hypothetical protein RZS08_03485, partial [Arthrospira platensis SPKY1]|nr:hypothetical protein [Arthrospira platensis SPKY1]